ncbi:MAG: ECF transporter S component [Bacillota bacterium]|jgi:uncharacterized membrane protein|nr:ECF transporter S component [Bacillota bacterium]NLV62126.1 ECF transporter S component [Clostridiaceae bacterium]
MGVICTNKRKTNLMKIVFTGLMTALVFIATSIIKIPFANGGYIHFGDAFIFLSVLLLGPFYGAFASGTGSMLSDLLSEYAQWAFPTLIIKSVMAVIMGFIIKHRSQKNTIIFSSAILTVWIGFMAVLKNMMAKSTRFSTDSPADALEINSETIVKMASSLQLKLSAAILIFFLIFGVLVYWIVKKRNITGFNPRIILGMISCGSWMIIGYYFAEYFLYGNAISPIFSIPMNLFQLSTGIIIAVITAPVLLRLSPIISGEIKSNDNP